ncbi:response regulator [Phenylobacterium sp.]|uniref:response regulator n=1 Tax=Phenylobacterium sp. TaxID=1871053 RepID=UPI0025F02229|nr:response regulator [Phenylobacterium sp.]
MRAAVSQRLAVALVLPAAAVGTLALGVAPNAHGAGRWLAAAAILIVAANTAVSLIGARRAARRQRQVEIAAAQARDAIDGAGRTIRAVLGCVTQEALPALETTLSKIDAMASDRRLSPSVRGRLKTLRRSGEGVQAVLQDLAGAPLAEEPASEVAASAPQAIPAPAPAPVPAEPEAANEAPAFQPVRPLRVLAAEANGVHQLVLRTLLAQIGVEPEIVAEGAEVIEAWRREPWDLILMDLQAPQVGGLAVARAIRLAEMQAGWTDTPIMGLASKPTAKDIADYEAAGVGRWVSKPLMGAELIEAIEAIVAAPPAMTETPAPFAPAFVPAFANVA